MADAPEKRRSKEIRVHRQFYWLGRAVFGFFSRRMYNLQFESVPEIKELQPPYLILSNHVNTFDPFHISVVYDKPIQWVAGDTLFRNPLLGYMMRRLIGSISKSKSRSDYYTIKKITETIRAGGIVGLFPEGQRTWDGVSLPVMYATAKLVRMLKVPVVICTLEGGYLALPRWTTERRRGRVIVSMKEIIQPDDLKGLSTEATHDLLTQRLYFDAYAYQRTHMVRFTAKRPAEHLEHVLYMCPVCESMATMESQGDTVTCTSCGAGVQIDEYGFFKRQGDITFQTVAEWNSWQMARVRQRLLEGAWSEDQPIFPTEAVRFGTGYRDRAVRYVGHSEVTLTTKGLYVSIRGEDRAREFPFDPVESVNVAFQRVFEFYVGNNLFRLKFPPPRSSAYKYLSVIEMIMEVKKQENVVT